MYQKHIVYLPGMRNLLKETGFKDTGANAFVNTEFSAFRVEEKLIKLFGDYMCVLKWNTQ